ncbi:MAG TPA: putative ABC transporter permease [Candidatus Olsenella pullistercoris]|uniref:ABC transporter permease n=1 Tax=Candidatus Olsenella pullistercoris TaxID=2838712 RepID=A0A9D2EZ63_9ACTN|nr:putative ABC transporter permease [Candidatus Olsenella pullistercoris]
MSTAPKPAPAESRKISVLLKVYGVYCLVTALAVLALVALLAVPLAQYGAQLFRESNDVTLTMSLTVIQLVTMTVAALGYVAFGVLVLRNRRRHVAQIAYALLGVGIVNLVLEIMLNGFGDNLIYDGARLLVLLVISATIDPTLITERRIQRRLREMETAEDVRAGTLGRAKGDRGFIELDFFNLFWVFVVCCVLGLVIEVIYHMVVVDPGVYQDRAGMLYGPFSPIYGFGAVLMTVALNRFYKANPVIIFLVSAVIGGLFEAAVSWFMQVGFGAVAWDYSGSTIFGLFPDPIAILFGGRTSTLFMCMWGALGFVWIKLCLPWLLKLINLIPWKARYSVTTLCALLMLVNGVMTLQALECWYQRESGLAPSSPVEEFYAEHYDNAYMQNRFQSMTITPEDSARVQG